MPLDNAEWPRGDTDRPLAESWYSKRCPSAQKSAGFQLHKVQGREPHCSKPACCLTFQTVISEEQCTPGDLILGTPEGGLLAKHPGKAEPDQAAELGQQEAAPLNPQPCRAHPNLAGLERFPRAPAPGKVSLAASEVTSSRVNPPEAL